MSYLCSSFIVILIAIRYDRHKDKVMCFVVPYYGTNKWELPIHEIEYPSTEGVDKYKWFARLFMEGAICSKMTQFQVLILYMCFGFILD
jgi:hypothetical protein